MGDNTLEVILRLKDQLSGELKKVSGNFKNASKSLENFGTKTRDMGANITAMTAPLGIMGALSIKAAGDFEASMKRVEGVTGSTGEELVQMTDLAKELGRTTMFSASEAASGMEFLGMAGFETSEILAAMPGVLSLAAAESMELGRAADIASNILGQFQLEASETDRVVNLLSATASSSNTNVLQMSEAFKYLGPTMNDLQVSVEDTATVIGILGDAGIQGSLAGRALGTSLVRLTDPTEDMAGAMNDLGVEFFNAQGEFIGVENMIQELNTSMADYTDEQRLATLASIFGKEALQEISILLNRDSDGYAELRDKISDTTKAQDKAAKMMEGWNGQVKALMSAFEGLQIAIGDSGVLKDLTNMVTKFTEFTRQLSETNPVLLRVGFYIGMLLVALGPLLIIIGQVAIGFSAVLPVLGALISPFTILAVVIAGAVAGFVYFIAKMMEVQQFADVMSGYLDNLNDKFVAFGERIYDALGFDTGNIGLLDFFNQLNTTILPVFADLINQVIQGFRNSMDTIGAFMGIAMTLADVVLNALTPVFNELFQSFQAAKPQIDVLLQQLGPLLLNALTISIGIIAIVTTMFLALFSGIMQGVSLALPYLIQAFTGLAQFLNGIMQIITGIFTMNWEMIWEGTKTTFLGIYNLITGLLAAIGAFVAGFVKGVIEFFQTLYMTLVGGSIVPDMVNAIIKWFTTLDERATAIIMEMVNGIVQWFQNLWNQATGIWRNIVNQIQTALQNMLQTATNIVNNIYNAISSTFQNAASAVQSAFGSMKNALSNALSSMYNKAVEYANKIKAALSKISPFHKSSPSLVEYVQMGSSEIINAYENLGNKIQGMDFGRDNAIAGMTPQPAFATARGGAQPTTNTDNRVVNINLGGVTVRNQSDIDNLVTQLSFAMKTDSSI